MKRLAIIAILVLLTVNQAFAEPPGQPRTGVIDSYGAEATIDWAHHKCHDGKCFEAFFNNTVTNTGEQSCVVFNTGTAYPHMVVVASATAAADFFIYRDTSTDADEGTDFTILNHDENSSTASVLKSIKTTPTVNAVSTFDETAAAAANITTTSVRHHEVIGQSGNPITTSGGEARSLSERILKTNTEYAVCLAALDDNDNVHNIILNWYE